MIAMAEDSCKNTLEEQKSLSVYNLTSNPSNTVSTSNCGNTITNAINVSAETVHLFAAAENRFIDCSFNSTDTREFEVNKNSSDVELSGCRKSLCQKLKKLYEDLEIPSAVWMEDRPKCRIEDYFIQLQLKSTNEEIAMEDIFKDVNHKRILMEGNPGYGKTTLVTKIAKDWTENKEYVDHFELLFLLQMKYLRNETIDDGIFDIAKIAGFEFRKTQNILQMNRNNILVIIDGLDESTPNQRENILKVLYKQIHSEMTVLVTCRTGYFTLGREEEQKLFKGMAKAKEFFDYQIVVKGISQRNRDTFLRKFIAINDTVGCNLELFLKEQVVSFTKCFQSDIFESPLLLVLLADYINETNRKQRELTNFTSITNFYKMILNLIVIRSEERNLKYLENDFDIFIENEMTKPYRELLHQFGSVSIDKFLKDKLVFSKTVLVTQIHELGLLLKQRNVMCTKCTTSYEVFHLSILEFLIAFFLYRDLEHHNFCKFSSDVECKVNEILTHSVTTTLILLFLMGLLKEKKIDIFKIIRPNPVGGCWDTHDILYHLTEKYVI